jgi:hypothetical protein
MQDVPECVPTAAAAASAQCQQQLGLLYGCERQHGLHCTAVFVLFVSILMFAGHAGYQHWLLDGHVRGCGWSFGMSNR